MACNDDYADLDGTVIALSLVELDVEANTRYLVKVTGKQQEEGSLFVTLRAPVGVAVSESPGLPDRLSIRTYPNPTNGRATVAIDLPGAARVNVVLYDVLGRAVQTIHDGPLAAGRVEMPLDARQLPGGIYLIRARTSAGDVEVGSMLVVK